MALAYFREPPRQESLLLVQELLDELHRLNRSVSAQHPGDGYLTHVVLTNPQQAAMFLHRSIIGQIEVIAVENNGIEPVCVYYTPLSQNSYRHSFNGQILDENNEDDVVRLDAIDRLISHYRINAAPFIDGDPVDGMFSVNRHTFENRGVVPHFAGGRLVAVRVHVRDGTAQINYHIVE